MVRPNRVEADAGVGTGDRGEGFAAVSKRSDGKAAPGAARVGSAGTALVLALVLALAGGDARAESRLSPPSPKPGNLAAEQDTPFAPAPPARLFSASDADGRPVALAMRPLAGPPLPPGLKPAIPRPSEPALVAAARFDPGQVGYLVYDLDTGEHRAGRNATRAAFLPASVLKVPTAVAALSILGPDHRFETTVSFDGTRDDGVWRGTLTLVGGGDPVLDSDDLRALVDDLRAAGLTRLEGRFTYDTSALIGAPALEPSQPPEHSYNPGLSALTLDFNRIRIRWNGDTVEEVRVHGTPAVAPVRVTRVAPGEDWRADGPPLTHAFAPPGDHDAAGPVVERWRLSPRVAARGARWLPVKAPAPRTAAVFRALAAEAGITLPEPSAATGPTGGPVVARHQSPPLAEIVTVGLDYSNNLLAELVGMAASRALEGRPLSLAASADRLEAWLRETLPWVDWTGFRMANHSGLSPVSRASPEQIVSVLRFALEQGMRMAPPGDDGRDSSFVDLMPDVRFPEPTAPRLAASVRAGHLTPRVWAKTGTMYFGRGLAGFARAASGHRLVFAVFASDLPARAAFDDRYLHYEGDAVARARAGLHRARALEHALVLKWIAEN